MEEKSALELYQSMRDDFFKKISEEDPDFKRLYDNEESSSLAQDQLTFSATEVIGDPSRSYKSQLVRLKNESLLKQELDELNKARGGPAAESLCILIDKRRLNDIVINSYMALLNERSKLLFNWKRTTRAYFFNSYFLTALTDTDGKFTYVKVKTWTINVNVFKAEKLFFPFHSANHWMLIVVLREHKKIKFYNSMSGILLEEGKEAMVLLLKWLQCEFDRIRILLQALPR